MKIYHEIFGVGDPLILLHGGLMTIGEMTALIQPLASHRKVIAVELQGHGRTPDTDRHIAEFFALLGGGLKDPGWQDTQLTSARLAIVPGYSHYNFITAPVLGSIIEEFLADALTKPQGGEAVSASKVT